MASNAIIKGVTVSPVNVDERSKLDVRAGDTVKVWQKIVEVGKDDKEKTRLQMFEGLVLARRHGGEAGGTFTVRRIASGVGVERIFPLYSPLIDKVEIVKRAKVRRAKLFHVRKKVAKEISREMRHLRAMKDEDLASETTVQTTAETPAESKAESKSQDK